VLGIWICKNFPPSCLLSNFRRGIERQYRSYENHGFGNRSREEVHLPGPRFLILLTADFRYQSRAFLLFPMCFNIGVIIGPILGGLLADPAGSYPKIFGHNKFLQKFPYAPPNLLSAFFLFSAALGVFFGLSEVRSPPGHLMRIY
jgi:hypothetical protein